MVNLEEVSAMISVISLKKVRIVGCKQFLW